jgi:DNA-binding GntR family transcriptional regulator
MARQLPKPPSPRISWSADSLAFKPRLLTKAQFAEARRKRADHQEKLAAADGVRARAAALNQAMKLVLYAVIGLAVAWAIVSFWLPHFKQ